MRRVVRQDAARSIPGCDRAAHRGIRRDLHAGRVSRRGRAAGRWSLSRFLSVLAGSQFAVSLVNLFATLARHAPCAAAHGFLQGHPRRVPHAGRGADDARSAPQNVDELVEALEVRFLANRDEQRSLRAAHRFPRRARRDRCPKTSRCWRSPASASKSSTASIEARKAPRFFLFHRPRRWNARERMWMGHERKRGKLEDLNRLLRGAANGAFALVVGETSVLPGRALRHHARHRHAIAAGCRPAA